MDQAANAHIVPGTINQSPSARDLFDADALQRLRGISALLDFVACGAKDDSGPQLWAALEYLALDFSNCVEELVAETLSGSGDASGGGTDPIR